VLAAYWGIGLLGWILVPVRLDLRWVGAAIGSLIILCIRGTTWDYYYLDIAAIGLFATSPVTAQVAAKPPSSRFFSGASFLLGGGLIVIAALHASVCAKAKTVIDNAHAVTVLCERALRHGSIGPSEISIAPFGFAGWNLYPYFIRKEGAGGAYIAEFINYLRPGAVRLQTRAAGDQRPLEDTASIVVKDVFRIGLFERHEFILRRSSNRTDAPYRIDDSHYVRPEFPLSDEEWRALVQ
jgi:hypothetical protein